MLDHIANVFLFFGDGIFIIPLVILGFIWLDRSIFYHAACLMLLCILINVALKNSFQIPLAPSLGKKGYAFPSGHMQLTTVFYVWMAYQVKKSWFSLLIVILLSGIGLSMVHFGYHNFYDEVAAVFVAFLLLILYYFSFLKWPKNAPWFGLIAATFLLIYIYAVSEQIANHVWMAYYTLFGLVTAEKIASKKIVATFIVHKLLTTLICFLTIFAIHSFFQYAMGRNLPAYVYQLQWLLIGFMLPCVSLCATGFMSQINKKKGHAEKLL